MVQKRLGGKPEDNLFDLVKDRRVAESVVAVIKGEILGYSTFLVREVERPLLWQGRDVAGSVLLRGNARKDARTVATTLQDGLDKRCGSHVALHLMNIRVALHIPLTVRILVCLQIPVTLGMATVSALQPCGTPHAAKAVARRAPPACVAAWYRGVVKLA